MENASEKKSKELLVMASKIGDLQAKFVQKVVELRQKKEEISVVKKEEKKLLASVKKKTSTRFGIQK